MKIETKDSTGNPNGFVLPIWSLLEAAHLRPDQIYLTSVLPGKRKGPHLHMERRGLFVCIRGNVRIVQRIAGKYLTEFSGEDHKFARIFVPPGVPAAIYNDGASEALVLNMPKPAWSPDQPDEHPVEGWGGARFRA